MVSTKQEFHWEITNSWYYYIDIYDLSFWRSYGEYRRRWIDTSMYLLYSVEVRTNLYVVILAKFQDSLWSATNNTILTTKKQRKIQVWRPDLSDSIPGNFAWSFKLLDDTDLLTTV